ncbi:gliding motility protein GldL [Flavobacterium sp. UBA6135]|uniref:gliding motility protein GldL n=1 Tax=Flavobacterium sp. UBA6135 TaxID=1946553 RepID=UPI0025C28E04|nr:gliding motility protein GldL [Flavobacterium sp. UBA6135]
MKYKYIIILFVIGVIITIFGALLKIIHFEIGPLTGNLILTIGMFTKIIAGIIFIVKLLSNNGNDFLNK